MNNIIFSSWQGKIVDNRGIEAEKHAKVDNIELPFKHNGYKIRAFIAWDGLVLVDDTVSVVDLVHSYLKEALKVCCGECTAGYLGLRVMTDIVSGILNGQGKEGDIDLLQQLGESIGKNAKCVFGGAVPTPVLDSIDYFRDDYLSLIKSPKKVSKSSYLSKIIAPCMAACPAHQDIPGYVDLIKNRRYEDSLGLIRKTNALPGMCGRACVAFCESHCTRVNVDTPVAIRMLKRVSADYEMGVELTLEKARNNRQKVAVIGAGPAGLAAGYNLALSGYEVTIYDELPSAGGMALVGIPPYRLPREVIDREVKNIQRLGVKFKLNTKLGRDITLNSLLEEGFRAIFIATGAHKGGELGIESEDVTKAGDVVIRTKHASSEVKFEGDGLVDGVKFLHDVNMGKKVEPKDKVIVIGGGNVAIDCARTCLRVGFRDVTIVYRRSRTEMPARKEEIEEAEKEGTKITFLANPVEILTEDSKVIGAECIRMELGEPDASGRRRPIPIPGSEFTIETDLIITAVGEQPDLSFLSGEKQIKTTEQGTIEVDLRSCQTNQSGIFSGGDCVTGPATLIEAIAFGNRAAKSIDQYLRTGHTNQTGEQLMEEISNRVDLLTQRDESLIAKSTRQSPQQLLAPSRIQNFDEVEEVLTPEAAHNEAERCLRCYRVLLVATDGKD